MAECAHEGDEGVRILTSILLVLLLQQAIISSLRVKERRKFSIQATRDRFRRRILKDDLLGDVVHLAVDQVPADGLFISGYSVLINESSQTGESEPVVINEDKFFPLSGTEVLDGSCM